MNKSKKSVVSILFDILGVIILLLLSLGIGSYSLARKVYIEGQQYKQVVKGVVSKENVTLVSKTRGVITSVNFKTGDLVSKGDLLITIDNPLLKQTIDAYEKFPDNLSAKTQAEVARKELEYQNIYSDINGVVGKVFVTESQSIQDLSQVMEIYSNDEVEIISQIEPKNYLALSTKNEIVAFSERLNQEILITPIQVLPEVEVDNESRKIIQIFKLVDQIQNKDLLEQEEIEISLATSADVPRRPVDYLVEFWSERMLWEK